MAKKEEICFIATGDINLNRERPESSFATTAQLLKAADITFGQLEANLSDRPSPQVHAPSICCVPAKNVSALTYAGYDIISFAGNHALDAGVQAMFDTLDTLKKNGIAVIGAGKDIEEARKPVILERKGTRIGFLAYNSIIPAGYAAGPDKPGCNPIRVSTYYEVVDNQPGTPPRILTVPNKEDVKAMEESIRALKKEADLVIVSQHAGVHFQQSVIPMYQKEIGRAAIDAGADLIIGAHAHILKGIEVYKGKVIFYSLCNFAMDAFLSRQVRTPHARQLFALYKYEPDPEYKTYPFPYESRKSLIVKAIISGKKIIRVSYLPVWINKQSEPELLPRTDSRSDEVIKYMDWLCQDQELSVHFSREGDEVVIS